MVLSIEMNRTFASIDLGSHTARLLIARRTLGSTISPLFRSRKYVRLAEDFGRFGDRLLTSEAMDRAVGVMDDFSRVIHRFQADHTFAVATGVVRDSKNADQLLNGIMKSSGIVVHVVSGEKEALLSGMGAVRSLGISRVSYLVFDLGGGSTEFVRRGCDGVDAKSLPMGAVGLWRKYAKVDPLLHTQMAAICSETDLHMQQAPLHPIAHELIIGTGGTVVSLAAMNHGISGDDIVPETMNGLPLRLEEIEAAFRAMNAMPLAERMHRFGLEPERAEVILAGSLMVIRIMRHLKVRRLLVSMSDLLEGILFDFMEGEQHA